MWQAVETDDMDNTVCMHGCVCMVRAHMCVYVLCVCVCIYMCVWACAVSRYAFVQLLTSAIQPLKMDMAYRPLIASAPLSNTIGE